MWCQIATFSILALCFSQVSALQCYLCNSLTDPKCGEPIDSSVGTIGCDSEEYKLSMALIKGVSSLLGFGDIPTPKEGSTFACAKIVIEDGDKRQVIRSCSVPNSETFDLCSQTKANAGGKVKFCEHCDTDGCNGASNLASSTLLMALLIALVAYLTKQ